MNKLMQKCHSIIVTGKVQDTGFRSIVEHIGRSFGMPGLVFNAKDGSVKILCCGEDSVIDNFTQTIKVRGGRVALKLKASKNKLYLLILISRMNFQKCPVMMKSISGENSIKAIFY